jgi:hypothetical protein
MFQELKFQLSTAVLTVLTLAAGAAAFINFDQQRKFRLPDDGVVWSDSRSGVEVLHVAKGSGAFRAGIRPGDRLKSIDGAPITKAVNVAQVLASIGSWREATYKLNRPGWQDFEPKVNIKDTPLDSAVIYQYLVGAAYLVIGLFVYFRRGSAYKARHFYIFCLVSFIFFSFHYTGKLNGFDKLIYYGNVVAGLFAPTIFLHFCLTFPETRLKRKSWLGVLYAPATLLSAAYLGLSSGAIVTGLPLMDVRWLLDRLWIVVAIGTYVAGAFVLARSCRAAEDPVVRQQLKWLRNGALAGFLPFAALYVIPYVAGAIPGEYLKLSVMTLVLVPLTLAYAIVRYRLMDVDVLFRRGYAYTLATLCVLAAFYGIVFALGTQARNYFKDLGSAGVLTVMLLMAFLFQPIRNWIQERVDRYFYRDQYDYRRTLVEFARELSSETDLDAMLSSVGERLLQTLSIRHLAFFLAEDDSDGRVFTLKKAMGEN